MPFDVVGGVNGYARCSSCKRDLPREHYHRDRDDARNRVSQCRDCRAVRRAPRRSVSIPLGVYERLVAKADGRKLAHVLEELIG